MAAEQPGAKRVCVIGSGIAGLTAAHLLAAEHHVTILERAQALGMDQSSVSFAGGRIDVPLRTFNLDYYPNLSALYRELGVAFGVADYSFCCFSRDSRTAYFRFYNALDPMLVRWLGTDKVSLPVLSLTTLRLVVEYVRFMWSGIKDLQSGACRGKTFQQYCAERYSQEFYWRLLMPWLSVVCTSSFAAVSNYPAEVIMDYVCGRRGSLLGNSMQRASSGTAQVVECFSKRCQRVLLGCAVTDVLPKNKNRALVEVKWVDRDGKACSEFFDEVILATQANAALESLSAHCSDEVRECLSGICYERSATVLHVDTNIMPESPADRSSVNLAVANDLTASDCTIWMNKVDSFMAALDCDVFQTWNPICPIEPSKIVAKFDFERPVLTLNSESILSRLQRVNGEGSVWFVGAYSLYTMPLLESGVRSAIRVSNRLLEVKRIEFGGILNETYECDGAETTNGRAGGAVGVLIAVGLMAALVISARR